MLGNNYRYTDIGAARNPAGRIGIADRARKSAADQSAANAVRVLVRVRVRVLVLVRGRGGAVLAHRRLALAVDPHAHVPRCRVERGQLIPHVFRSRAMCDCMVPYLALAWSAHS